MNKALSHAVLMLLSAAFIFVSFGCKPGRFLRAEDLSEVPVKGLVDDLKGADVVFLGELHNELAHHRMQLGLIRALKNSGVRFAVGLEMFQAEYQNGLDMWVAGEMDKEEFKRLYKKNWNVAWKNYEGIFVYARENNIPLVALNIPRKMIHKVFKGGFGSLSGEEMEGLEGVTCEVDREYEEFIKKSIEEHEMDSEKFKNFCEAQMLWDVSMALNIIRYQKDNPETAMVVLAGGGHSWKRGIPEQVRRRSGLKYLVVLPDSESFSEGKITTYDADYIWEEGAFSRLR